MLFNGKTLTKYKGHDIDNGVAFSDENDGFLTIRLAKRCVDPKYKFINKFSVKVNPDMALAMGNRLVDWATLAIARQEAKKTDSAQQPAA